MITEEITMRTRFVETVTELLDEDPKTALVLADISAYLFTEQAQRTRIGCSTGEYANR